MSDQNPRPEQTRPTPSTLLARIVEAYEALVRAELTGKHDVVEAARDALSDLIDEAKALRL